MAQAAIFTTANYSMVDCACGNWWNQVLVTVIQCTGCLSSFRCKLYQGLTNTNSVTYTTSIINKNPERANIFVTAGRAILLCLVVWLWMYQKVVLQQSLSSVKYNDKSQNSILVSSHIICSPTLFMVTLTSIINVDEQIVWTCIWFGLYYMCTTMNKALSKPMNSAAFCHISIHINCY